MCSPVGKDIFGGVVTTCGPAVCGNCGGCCVVGGVVVGIAADGEGAVAALALDDNGSVALTLVGAPTSADSLKTASDFDFGLVPSSSFMFMSAILPLPASSPPATASSAISTPSIALLVSVFVPLRAVARLWCFVKHFRSLK